VVIAIVTTVIVLSTSRSAPSNEDQIRAVWQSTQNAYNAADFTTWRSNFCVRRQSRLPTEYVWKTLHPAGRLDNPLQSIAVSGDSAIATVTNTANPRSQTQTFARENGDWKVC
jgi:hypothetical protein